MKTPTGTFVAKTAQRAACCMMLHAGTLEPRKSLLAISYLEPGEIQLAT
jgi:hypothetical protein